MHWMKSQIYCSDVHLVQVFDDDCLIIKYLSKASLSIFWSGIGDEKFAPFWQLQTTKNSFNCTVTSYFLCQVNDETKWCSRTSEMMNSVPISREMPPLMRSTKELSSLTKQSVACSDANPEDCPLSLSLSLSFHWPFLWEAWDQMITIQWQRESIFLRHSFFSEYSPGSSFLIPPCPPTIAKSVFTQVSFTLPSLPWWMAVPGLEMRRRGKVD